MEIERFPGGFITRYSTGAIKESVTYYDSNSVWFTFFSGKKTQAMLPNQIKVDFFSSQFGISVTKDGRYFFIQSWEKNTVFCFRITDCKKMWTAKIKHPYGLCVCDKFLICYAMYDGVFKLANDSGKAISQFRCTYTKFFRFLNDLMFLIGPIKKEYKVMDFDFRQLSAIPIDIVNPNHYDTFLIKEVSLDGNALMLSGTEYNSIDLSGLTYHEQERLIEKSKFRREIDISPFFTAR